MRLTNGLRATQSPGWLDSRPSRRSGRTAMASGWLRNRNRNSRDVATMAVVLLLRDWPTVRFPCSRPDGLAVGPLATQLLGCPGSCTSRRATVAVPLRSSQCHDGHTITAVAASIVPERWRYVVLVVAQYATVLGGNCSRKELGAALGQAEGLVNGLSAGVLENRATGDMASLVAPQSWQHKLLHCGPKQGGDGADHSDEQGIR